jgi:hypothetical protein
VAYNLEIPLLGFRPKGTNGDLRPCLAESALLKADDC